MSRITSIVSVAADLFEALHPGQPWRTITLDDLTLRRSTTARKVADAAEFIGCDPMDLVNAAERLIADDAAEYAAIKAEDIRREAEEEALLG